MWGALPKVSEISEHTCLAVLALLDPVPWSSVMLRGQGSAPMGGFFPVSVHTAGARTQEEVLVVLNALFEQLKGEMFSGMVYWKSRVVWLPTQRQGPHSVMKVCTQGCAGAHSGMAAQPPLGQTALSAGPTTTHNNPHTAPWACLP